MKNIMVTGGAGFIGSNFVIYMLDKYPQYNIIVYDKLTYAGNMDNLLEVSDEPRFRFVKGDICDAVTVEQVIQQHNIDTIVNFAAETHVDRSIMAPDAFIQTGVYGTYVLLEAARKLKLERYHQISSVTGDTPVLVRDETTGETILRPIEWLDGQEIGRFSVLTMTDDNQVTFRRMKHFIKHPTDELFEVTYNGGGQIRATGSHSIFVFENGRIITKPTSELQVGDLLITFVGEVEADSRQPHEFHLLDLLADYQYEGLDAALDKRQTVLETLSHSAMPYKTLKTAVSASVTSSSAFRVAAELAENGYLQKSSGGVYQVTQENLLDGLKTAESLRQDLIRRKLHIERDHIPVTPLLMEIFGLYLAEGHCSHTPAEMAKNIRSVTFTVGGTEEDKVKLLVQAARDELGIEPTIKHRGNSIQISYRSYWVHAIFSQFGVTAETKHLPHWVWTQPRSFIEAFFRGYEGDAGIKSDSRRIYTTVNLQLAQSLVWLARLNNINILMNRRLTQQIAGKVPPNSTVTRQRLFYDLQVTAENYRREESANWRTPMSRCIPTQTLLNHYGHRQHKGINMGYKPLVGKEKAQQFANTHTATPTEIKNLLNSPIGVAKIKSIRRIEETVMVYDVSVPNNERFFGGNVPILLHNTDEVYGHIPHGKSSVETDKLEPRSPYSASKAGADLLVNSYFVTYNLPVTITRGSNNIGPYQYPEKAVPLFATNAIDSEPLPVYGDGRQMREYQFVIDHCEAIDLVLHKGVLGDIYNVGTSEEVENMQMVEILLETLERPHSLIRHVADRPGHDRRYSMNSDKIKALGWQPRHTPQEAIRKTAVWYAQNEWWWRKIKSGEFQKYYEAQYGARLKNSGQ